MKRIGFVAIIIALVLTTLTSCVIIPRYKKFEIDSAKVTSIEIYDLCTVDTLYGNFVKTETPVYQIPTEQTNAFLKDLAQIRFSDALVIALMAMDPSFYYDDWTIRINYTDGSFELISSDGHGQTFDANGQMTDYHHWGCDNEEWWNFIAKYVPEDIFEHEHTTDTTETE